LFNSDEFKVLSFEEKVNLGKEILTLEMVNLESTFASKEEVDLLNNLIPSYSEIVKKAPLDLFPGSGCKLDINFSKDCRVIFIYRNAADLKGAVRGGMGSKFSPIKTL
jgi:hypothetical protein